MSLIKINNITNRNGDTGPIIAGVSSVRSTGFMIMPSGNTEIRGAGSGRGIHAGGSNSPSAPNGTDVADYFTIATTGNAVDFGNLSVARYNPAACSSSTRGIFAGGQGSPGTLYNVMDYFLISSGGGAIDFGDVTEVIQATSFSSNSTRGVMMGGQNPNGVYTNTRLRAIRYIEMATTGNTNGFGELSANWQTGGSGLSSPTRAFIPGGQIGTGPAIGDKAFTSDIDFVTFASGGNSIKFGELNFTGGYYQANCTSTTRGLIAAGANPATTNTISYITMASDGNAVDFGDRSVARFGDQATSNKIRGVFAGGYVPSPATFHNTIDYVTIASLGNAADFGDLTLAKYSGAACSDVHGGLG